MKILKHGKQYTNKKNFTCWACGCEFEANYTEYSKKVNSSGDHRISPKFPYSYVSKCPECGTYIKIETEE